MLIYTIDMLVENENGKLKKI